MVEEALKKTRVLVLSAVPWAARTTPTATLGALLGLDSYRAALVCRLPKQINLLKM